MGDAKTKPEDMTPDERFEDRMSDGMIVISGDTVIYDGEAEHLGVPSMVGQKVPLPPEMQEEVDAAKLEQKKPGRSGKRKRGWPGSPSTRSWAREGS